MWEINAYDQLITVVYSIACGGILCAFYDIIRAARAVRRGGYISVFISDLVFSAISGVAVFFLLLARTCGEIRGYALFGVALGFLLFRIILSPVFFRLFHFLFSLIKTAAAFISRAVKKLCLAVLSGFSLALGKAGAIFDTLKKLLKKPQKVLYNNEKCEKAGDKANGD